MKILFMRHGESVDDIEDRYGGAADFDLTEKGREQASEAAQKLLALGEKFEIILSSPLKRAIQTAEVVSTEFGLQVEIFEYLKERNLNGVLTGLIRSEAKKKYPELVEAHGRWEYIDGSERETDFTVRVRNGINYILNFNYDSIIAVTHGLFLRTFFKVFLNLDVKKIGDGSFVSVEENNDKFIVLKTDGIEYEAI